MSEQPQGRTCWMSAQSSVASKFALTNEQTKKSRLDPLKERLKFGRHEDNKHALQASQNRKMIEISSSNEWSMKSVTCDLSLFFAIQTVFVSHFSLDQSRIHQSVGRSVMRVEQHVVPVTHRSHLRRSAIFGSPRHAADARQSHAPDDQHHQDNRTPKRPFTHSLTGCSSSSTKLALTGHYRHQSTDH